MSIILLPWSDSCWRTSGMLFSLSAGQVAQDIEGDRVVLKEKKAGVGGGAGGVV